MTPKKPTKPGAGRQVPLQRAATHRHPGTTLAGDPKQSQAQPRASREQRTATMLDAAAQLFAERGPRNMSVRDIAASAGVSHALVHRYLGTKEEILAAVLVRSDNRVRATAEGVHSFRDAGLAMLREDRRTQPSQLRIVANAAMAGVSLERLAIDFPTARQLVELAEEEYAASQQETLGRGIPPRLLVAGLFALVIGWVAAEDWLREAFDLDDLSGQPVEESLERLVTCLIDAVMPPAADAGDQAGDPPPSPH